MISKYASALIVIGTLLVPLTSHADDRDKDRSHPTAWVKDSAITTQIKAKYAEDKQVSVKRIHVDTDDKGKVQLAGTARSKAEKQKAAEIAKSVDGVVSVDNRIKIASKKQTS